MAGRLATSPSLFGTSAEITGSVLMNGEQVSPREVIHVSQSVTSTNPLQAKKIVGYVMQNDHLLPHLTARETLQYAGLLRLPASLPYREKLNIVKKILPVPYNVHPPHPFFLYLFTSGRERHFGVGVKGLCRYSSGWGWLAWPLRR